MLGDKILVAPIAMKRAFGRKVMLPPGTWVAQGAWATEIEVVCGPANIDVTRHIYAPTILRFVARVVDVEAVLLGGMSA
jgi:alpha-glucosidase (family GH31 glycosyl hydrolase)